MEWLPIILISGLCCSPSFCANYPNHYLVELLGTWNEAHQYCKNEGTDLASIENIEEMRSLLPLMGDKADVWIGLYGETDRPTRFHWSLVDDDFYKPGEKDYRNLKSKTQTGFVYFAEDGLWDSNGAPEKLWAMCYDANKQGRDRYVLVEQLLKYYEAINYCRNHHTDLVSIRNAMENQIINDVSSGQKVWIGLFRDDGYWLDTSQSSFRSWDDDHKPGPISAGGLLQECGFIATQSGKWDTSNCFAYHRFFCTSVKRTTGLKVRLNSEGLLDLNDPAIKAAVFKQIRQLVEGPTLTNGLTMTWKTKPDGTVFTKEGGKDNKKT